MLYNYHNIRLFRRCFLYLGSIYGALFFTVWAPEDLFISLWVVLNDAVYWALEGIELEAPAPSVP
jgi:hypothetical protein